MMTSFLSKLKIKAKIHLRKWKEGSFALLKFIQMFFVKKTYLVLGDSHAKIFNHWMFIREFPEIYFDTCAIIGATASGIDNPNSKTRAADIFFKRLNKRRFDGIIIQLGEVDVGFVIWYRIQKYQLDVNIMLARTIQTYCNFLEEVSRFGKTMVLSAPLPTIQDQNDWGEVANLRKDIKASQEERTQLTLQLNSAVQAYCDNNQIIYINLDQLSLGADGLVKPQLKNRDPQNHHYDDRQYATMIIQSLNELNLGAH